MNRKAASAKGGSAAPRASRKATKGHAQAGAVSSTGNLNALAAAVAAYTSGACAEAAQLARPIVDAEPANFDALHLLAVACAGSGDESGAMLWFDKAAALRPDSPELLCNRGNALRTLGRIEEALTDYDHAVKVAPQFAGAWSNRALILLQLKRYAEAVDSTDRALALQPDLAEALNNRGNALRELKRPAEALASYDGAIKLRPDFAEAWSNRGNALRDVQRLADALASYDRAVVLRPQYAVAWCNRGNVLRDLKRHDEALASYERATQLWPGYALAWINHGNVLRDTQRHEEAIASYERAIAIDPASVDAHCNIGVVQHTLERYADSLISYDRALAVDPNSARAWHNRGVALRMLKRNADALASYDRALMLQPHFPEALSNRGNSLRDLGDLDQAIVEFDRAIALRPQYPEAWCNRGAVLYALNRFDEAIESLDRAIEIRPTFAVAHSNRGAALSELCRYEESIAAYDQAIALDAASAEAWLNRSLCRLQQGDFARGWAEYEWRWRDEQLKTRQRDFPQPLWLGREPLAGKTILLHAEQGLGDTLQFCRYVAQVAALGATVVLEVQVSLKNLMAGLPGVSVLVGKGEALPPFDFHCPLLSLPLAFGTALETIPHQVPYLHADEIRLAKWQARLGPAKGLRVGLVWSGSPSHKNDRNRSLALEWLSGLLTSDATVEFVSLQKEIRSVDQAWLSRHGGLKHFGAELVDFAETAALAACMDVVVAVDTSVAHLAGALGKKLWVLLPFNPDWRWLLERNDSPWYPNATLFRQAGPGAWPAVIAQVTHELGKRKTAAGASPADPGTTMVAAAEALGKGRFDQVVALCGQVLAAQPDHFDARHLMGIAEAQRSQFAKALGHFDLALQIMPTNPNLLQNRAITLDSLGRTEEALRSVDAALARDAAFTMAYVTRGNLLIKLGRAADALSSFDAALARQPGLLDALVNRGMAQLHLGRPLDALQSYDAALRVAPDRHAVHVNKANVLNDLKRHAEALESIDRALALDATNPQAHLNRGNLLLDLKRPADALASFDRALALNPRFAEAHSNRGVALKLLNRVEDALQAFESALAIAPDYAHALSNRGNALRETGRDQEALESFARALAIDPDYADALSSRAEVLRAQDRYDEALQSADRAIALAPDLAGAHVNRGLALLSMQRQDEALVSMRRALSLQPDSALAHLNHAIILLQTGQLAQAWPEYEWRWRDEQLSTAARDFPQPLWLGDQPLEGKTILLHAEQGLGDTLQFCRYVPLVAGRGASVILEVQPALMRLFSGLAGVTTLIARGEALPPFDLQCPLMSLPLAFGTTLETIPAPIPSLHADPTLVKKWSARLGRASRPRVGLVWSGSPTHRRDRERSISFSALRKLLVPGVQYVCLQKVIRPDDAAALAASGTILDLSAEIDDMADTAALVELMDLVITVDTSVAHLAGALGRRTSLLLPVNPDWRWLLARPDSPWYPEITLLRQTAPGDWNAPLAQLQQKLSALVPAGTPQAAPPDNTKDTAMNRNVIRRPAPFVLMSSGHGTMIVNRNDYRMVDEQRGYGVGFQLLSTSWFDPDEVGIALQILELRRKHFGDGVMALDCGANVGVHTVEWAKQMFGWGQVIGIEAQERIYYALAGNVAINNCLNASVRHAAVGAGVGKLSIPRLDYCKPSSFGSFELKQRAGTEFIGQSVDYAAGNAQEIDLISIDSLRCARLDFIKIDVEGMELEVLDGARLTIEAMRPQMLIESIKTDRARLLAWLTERGYQSLQLGINILAVHRGDPALPDVLRLFNVGKSAAASAVAAAPALAPAAAKTPRIVASISPAPATLGAAGRAPRVTTTTIDLVPLHQRLNEAVVAFQARNADAAARICTDLLKENPNYFDALHLMGVLEAQRRHSEAALAYFDKANAITPDNPQLLNNRGIVLKDLYRNDEALASIDRALVRDPNNAEAHANRGNVLRAMGRAADALTSLDRAIAYRPQYAEALSNRSNVLQDLGRFEEAVAGYDKALALNPNYAEAWSNRGNALRELRRYPEALASQDRAVAVEPGRAVTHNNRGNVLRDLDRRDEGLASYDEAIKLMPDYAEAWSNRGNLLQDMGRDNDAMASYEQALKLRDQLPEAHLNQSFCRLLGGDFAKGWEQYEWRWRDRQMERVKRNFTQPLWLGKENLKGKAILLYAEQGLGDTLQFCRYAALVAARGARVLLEVQAPLKGLLAGLPGVDVLLGKGEPLPPFDFQTPLMSLPLALGTQVDTIPAGAPYVKAESARVAQWRKKLGKKAKGGMRVGLVWSGRVEHKNDRNRSLALAQLADLIKGAKAGTQFVSLQKEMRPTDVAWLKQHGGVLDFSADLKTFEDTAALIELMDVVISVDTSIAHLAGAMGKPLRLLLPFHPDFRWMRERTDSPWYPGAKLYRKPLNGTWDTVLKQVGTDLAS